RKFLVDVTKLPQLNKGKKLCQGYLWSSPDKSLRIRIVDNTAFLTIKTGTDILQRSEFEYEIPISDAEELLQQCDNKIEKERFILSHAGNSWEIDIFYGRNKGLIVAEIELLHKNQAIELPEWVTQEVTNDTRYLNVSLANHPFLDWK
ncbi:MAG: adenylate cyclase, partial [Bacteroidetes bacterium]